MKQKGANKAVHPTLTRVTPDCLLASLAASVAPRASVSDLQRSVKNMSATRSSSFSSLACAMALVYAIVSIFLIPVASPVYALMPEQFFLRSRSQLHELAERGISLVPYYVVLGITISGLVIFFAFAMHRAQKKTDFGFLGLVIALSAVTCLRLFAAISGI